MDTRSGIETTRSRWPLALALVFVAEWLLLAIHPYDRKDWLLENLLTALVCAWLLWRHRRAPLSTLSYLLLFLFGSLHEVGAHYTYSEVPYERWAQHIGGFSIDALFGFSRNMFDRLVHFLFGFLLFVPIQELLDQSREIFGRARWWVPVAIVSTVSMLYEIFEWAAAEVFGGGLGQAYLGTQGDVWDAQKDMLAALVGSLLAAAFLLLRAGARRRAP